MGPSGVNELSSLGTIFGKIYAARRPRRLAVLGVATGNGLEHIDLHLTWRTVCVDVNLSYLAVARQRHMRLGPSLELMCADGEKVQLGAGSFDLVHAALVLEYLDVRVVIPRVASWLAPGGAFSVVTYLPKGPPLSLSRFASLRALSDFARIVAPEELRRLTRAEGLAEKRAFMVPLASGRRFFVALYEKAASGE